MGIKSVTLALTLALASASALSTTTIASDAEGEHVSSFGSGFFSNLFGSFRSSSRASVEGSREASTNSSAASLHFCGVGSLVEKVAIPLNGQDPDYIPQGWGFGEMVSTTTLDGVKISGNWSEVKTKGPTVILFHGNGMNADHYAPWARWFNNNGFNVLAFTIQGYPGSEGSSSNLPVSSALLVEAAVRFATEEKKIPHEHLAVYGFSLGGAYASYAAKEFHLPLVLQNTFTKIGDIPGNLISKYFPSMLGEAIARSNLRYQEGMPPFSIGTFEEWDVKKIPPVNSFNNLENLTAMRNPKSKTHRIMIIYAESDNLMGAKDRALELYDAAYSYFGDSPPNPRWFVGVPGGHCDVFLGNPEAEERVRNFLYGWIGDW